MARKKAKSTDDFSELIFVQGVLIIPVEAIGLWLQTNAPMVFVN